MEKILIVDDSALQATQLKSILKDEYDITIAQKGEEGLRLGRYYCWVDQAKYAAYGKGYRCLHDKNTMDGDDCCVIRVELEAPEE